MIGGRLDLHQIGFSVSVVGFSFIKLISAARSAAATEKSNRIANKIDQWQGPPSSNRPLYSSLIMK